MFTLKQSVGMVGGKPNHAYYFIGFNGIYVDIINFCVFHKHGSVDRTSPLNQEAENAKTISCVQINFGI